MKKMVLYPVIFVVRMLRKVVWFIFSLNVAIVLLLQVDSCGGIEIYVGTSSALLGLALGFCLVDLVFYITKSWIVFF